MSCWGCLEGISRHFPPKMIHSFRFLMFLRLWRLYLTNLVEFRSWRFFGGSIDSFKYFCNFQYVFLYLAKRHIFWVAFLFVMSDTLPHEIHISISRETRYCHLARNLTTSKNVACQKFVFAICHVLSRIFFAIWHDILFHGYYLKVHAI
jgi:hypothetical protein